MKYDKKLSDIRLETDGFTQEDVINDRLARQESIKEAANRGNWIALESLRMDALAREYGVDVTYSEDLDEEDMGGMY